MMRVLEYYSVPTGSNHSIDHFYYIPRMTPEEVSDDLTDLLTWYIAREVSLILKDKEAVAACTEKIAEIQLSNSF
jgi:hypothetical protein